MQRKTKNETSFVNGWVCRGFKNTLHQSSGSISKKRREHVDFCAFYMCNLRSNVLLSFNMESTLGVKYDLILALRSQIFESLRATFYRNALEYLQSARSEKKK